ncbi:MAG TPA: membrane dipeptidase [Chloroflexia bacterium]|nr:membrane dipeptidase [Chloroflexia bacterium]
MDLIDHEVPATRAARPFTMDGHQDALFYAQAYGGTAVFDAGGPTAQLDLPGLRAGEVDAALWAVFGHAEQQEPYDPATAIAETDTLLDGYRAWVAGNPAYRLLYDAADVQELAQRHAATTAGDPTELSEAGPYHASEPEPFGVLLHCEGARGIAGVTHLEALHARGLRSVGLTWNGANAYATGAHGDPATPLTAAGKELVGALNRLHMMVDGAHLNRQGLWDLLETSTAPIAVTHTGCAALHADPRNLQDDQIRAVAAAGGVIGVFMVNMFLAPTGSAVTLDTLLAHYDHLLELVGPDHVTLGSDYGGVSSGLPAGLERSANLPRLYAAFAARGYSAETIAAIRGGNYLRLLSAVL